MGGEKEGREGETEGELQSTKKLLITVKQKILDLLATVQPFLYLHLCWSVANVVFLFSRPNYYYCPRQ